MNNIEQNLNPQFQVPEILDDHDGFVIEPGNPTEPLTERRLLKKVGGETLQKIYTHSYGLRDVGWILLASGSVYVTKKGIEYFKDKYPEEIDD